MCHLSGKQFKSKNCRTAIFPLLAENLVYRYSTSIKNLQICKFALFRQKPHNKRSAFVATLELTMRSDVVRARVSSELKHDSEEILNQMGMSMSDAIRIFLNQVTLRHEFPIELRVPNPETLNAMQEPVCKETYESAGDLFDEVLEKRVHD